MRLTIRNIRFEESCDIQQCQKDRWNSDGDMGTTDGQHMDKAWKALAEGED